MALKQIEDFLKDNIFLERILDDHIYSQAETEQWIQSHYADSTDNAFQAKRFLEELIDSKPLMTAQERQDLKTKIINNL